MAAVGDTNSAYPCLAHDILFQTLTQPTRLAHDIPFQTLTQATVTRPLTPFSLFPALFFVPVRSLSVLGSTDTLNQVTPKKKEEEKGKFQFQCTLLYIRTCEWKQRQRPSKLLRQCTKRAKYLENA